MTGHRAEFQSTPPRGGRLTRCVAVLGLSHVSIHAPAWGATPDPPEPPRNTPVSIHAPAWGATAMHLPALSLFAAFQSTPPRGGRLGWLRRPSLRLGCFNPRPRVGGDQTAQKDNCRDMMFQSTPPRGGRPARITSGREVMSCFNPRPRVGGDLESRTRARARARFNPRPRVGGDYLLVKKNGMTNSFNPRPRVGGDVAFLVFQERFCPVSIHAPAWGATYGKRLSLNLCAMFQSTPPRGGRHDIGLYFDATLQVSIHAPAWGATVRVGSGVGQSIVSIHAPAWGATGREQERGR